ncbi:protein of unknown function [Methylocaldum szegediense]|uniref:Transposase n=1 Tax=Methylocaldum szegediense TaxID=73780 RepID=A0ABN8X682_9GAMM|nr:protein of unknown function [Methylocaldum szegediense]
MLPDELLTVRLLPEGAKGGFVQSDYQPLWEHYREKNFRVHVIQEYVRKGLVNSATGEICPRSRCDNDQHSTLQAMPLLAASLSSLQLRWNSSIAHPVSA